jgi:hypothetical protein
VRGVAHAVWQRTRATHADAHRDFERSGEQRELSG